MSFFDRFCSVSPDREAHAIFHIPGLLYKATGRQGGHVRLFRKPNKGVTLYAWNKHWEDWPLIERWYIPGILTIGRVTPGSDPTKLFGRKPGWHFRWAKLRIKREPGGFSVRWTLDKGYNL